MPNGDLLTTQDKSALVIDVTGWSPASKGGFSPGLFEE
jgi:hypothetical protein